MLQSLIDRVSSNILVGIVVSPAFYEELRENFSQQPNKDVDFLVSNSIFGVGLYKKVQKEKAVCFYDREELNKYLNT